MSEPDITDALIDDEETITMDELFRRFNELMGETNAESDAEQT